MTSRGSRARAGPRRSVGADRRRRRREPVVVLGVEPDELHQLLAACRRLRHAVDDQGVGDDRPDTAARVEGTVGVLEDDLHVAAQGPHLLTAETGKVGAADLHRAGGGREQPSDQAGKRRLARPGLSDEPEGLAGTDRQVDTVDGTDHQGLAEQTLPSPGEELDEPVGAQEQVARRRRWVCAVVVRTPLDDAAHASRGCVDRQHALRSVARAQLAYRRERLARRRSSTCGQLGANAQPGGRRSMLGGCPVIGTSAIRASSPRDAGSTAHVCTGDGDG